MKDTNFRSVSRIVLVTWLTVLLRAPTSAQRVNPCTGQVAPTCNPNRRFRTLSGVCNNLDRPFAGAVNTAFRRLLDSDYADGRSRPRESQVRGEPLPNPRTVSLNVFRDANRRSPRLSHMAMVFGQFLAHDITLAGLSEGVECETERFCQQSGECVGIPINPPEQNIRDPRFPGPENVRCIRVIRDRPCNGRSPRQQVNLLTSFIDASHIYGTNSEELDDISFRRSLRPLGLLANVPQNDTTLENLLPPSVNPHTLCLSPDPVSRPCFVTGDFRRNNENSALNSLHTIWVREHNRIALQLHWLNPSWSGGRLFQEARKIVGAMMQHITYNEFLPIMLGQSNVEHFGLELLTRRGQRFPYDYKADPSIPNAMAAAALRFGHSTVRNHFSRRGPNSRRFPSVRVREFHNPEFLYDADNGGVDSILRGLFTDPAQNIDPFFADAILNNIIPEEGVIGDLMAINIQRAREHGVPGYNRFREWCNLGRASRFADFSSTIPSGARRDALQRAYENVDDVDLFAGGISEAPSSSGGGLGPTFACILGNGFSALRRGDRFWYETDQRATRFTSDQLQAVRNATLARIICNNSDGIRRIQPRVLLQQNGANAVTSCENLPFVDLNAWKA